MDIPMNASGQIICLNMIVKNEASVIRRCLDSVRPIINRWVIVDTGSTDGTQDIIREHLRDLPGELHERPWRNFAHNRSEALELARGQCDYALIIDADDTLEIEPGTVLPHLTADSYMMEIRISTVAYRRPQLVRAARAWRYEGVLHEYLTCEGAGPPGLLTGMLDAQQSRMARAGRIRGPYQRDAAVLEDALRTETDPFLIARYRFYLAQSYRDCRALGQGAGELSDPGRARILAGGGVHQPLLCRSAEGAARSFRSGRHRRLSPRGERAADTGRGPVQGQPVLPLQGALRGGLRLRQARAGDRDAGRRAVRRTLDLRDRPAG